MVGEDQDDLKGAAGGPPQPLRRFAGSGDLRRTGKERIAIAQREAVPLRVRQLEAVGAYLFGEGDEGIELVDVVAVQDDVHRERQTERDNPPTDLTLLLERVEARNAN